MTIEERARLAEKREQIFAHLGSARASRAGNGALAIANFSWLGMSFGLPVLEAFRRERRNVHARARALPGSGIILPGSVISRSLALLGSGNYLDFHIGSSRQRGDLDGGTGRGILFEIRAVYLVYRLEVGEIREENGCLDDVIQSQAFRS